MNVLDLFSGIGGFSLGLERAGMKTIAFCEIDEWCQRVLKKHWPDVPIYNDIRSLDGKQFTGTIDLICGGFPCQDISIAGKGVGIEGERSGLWKEYARLISEIRPKYVLVENVPALLHRGLGVVLADLAACGYDAEWDCIPASAIGAPHQRDRFWLIAYPTGIGMEEGGNTFSRVKTRLSLFAGTIRGYDWREVAAELRGVDDGIPHNVHRGYVLGNAVVPPIPEAIGGVLMEIWHSANHHITKKPSKTESVYE